MKPERQRIAIAKVHLGLLPIDGERVSDCGHLIMLTNNNNHTAFCPDYLSDLNAMHEAVKTLPQEIRPRYFACLCSVVSTAISAYGYSEATEATAAQRAEAFLRALNKWEDAP